MNALLLMRPKDTVYDARFYPLDAPMSSEIRPSFHFVLAGCGSGGHVLPLKHTGQWLSAAGHRVTYITDARGWPYLNDVEDAQKILMPWPHLTSRWSVLRHMPALGRGLKELVTFFHRECPDAVWSFGGHMALATLGLVALLFRVPLHLYHADHDVNLHLRILGPWAEQVAGGSPSPSWRHRFRYTCVGWPLSPLFCDAMPYPALPDHFSVHQPLRLLVLGGSQGSRFWHVFPHAVQLLLPEQQACLHVTHQHGSSQAVNDLYRMTSAAWETFAFKNDMAVVIASAHVVLTRGGAFTLAELQALGRPGYVVPIDFLTHQKTNAAQYAPRGWYVPQQEATAAHLAAWLRHLLTSPSLLHERGCLSGDDACRGGTARLGTFMLQCAQNHAVPICSQPIAFT